jgi:hypothetical protein
VGQSDNEIVNFNLQVKLPPWRIASINVANAFNQWPD